MARGRHDALGVAVSDLTDPFYAPLAAAAAHLRASGSVHAVVLDAWAGPDRRTEIVLDALARAGLHAVTHPAGGPGYRDGHRATHEVLRRGVPDVVVGWNDPIAIGTLAALAERGIGVPDQTQVLGIDGLSVAEFTAPALSTVVLDPEVVARVSVDAALRCSTGAAVGAEDRQQFVHHTFVPRGTTR
jgi:DNA-binding LacI/PurR family transcriptional regulator